MKLFNPDSTHWYKPDGQPMHHVAGAGGEMRPTTIRDARKLGLLPSVTNILGVIGKPELTAWLQEQAVLAALTLPRLPGEAENEFAKRVVADAQSVRDQAAAFGTEIHRGAERVALTMEVDDQNPVAPWLKKIRQWHQANCARLVWAERTLVNLDIGYAGTADLLIEHQKHGLTLVDIKTQGVKPGMQAKAYRTWCYQLAAYRAALGAGVTCLNLMINSREAADPVEHRWSEDEMQRGWAAFLAAQTLWCIEKSYDPTSWAKTEKKGGKKM